MWFIFVQLALLVGVVAAAAPHLKIPRQPDKEGINDLAAVQAYEQVSRWSLFRFVRGMVLRELRKYPPQGTLVDIGCGPGYLAARISREYPQLQVIGLDIDERMIALAQKYQPASTGRLDFQTGSAQKIPFANGSVDFVISTLALHHFASIEKVLEEIYRVLPTDGQFLILDLRRDCRRGFYLALQYGQAFLAPEAIVRTNGAIGSVWASYTPIEIKALLSKTSFRRWKIKPNFGWMFIWGQK